jgi:hypothetical protein
LFVSVLHLVDSWQAYSLVSNETAKIWEKLPSSLSADDLAKLQGLLTAISSPSGIAGTTRSILTYALIIILGIAVFHLLALPPADPELAADYAGYADKILILLAGSLTTAVGFYFGAKATTEAVAAGKQDVAQPSAPSGHIERVEPDHGAPGAPVIIKGTGFGKDQGNVQFGDVAVGTIDNWSETSISLRVPVTDPEKVDVTVNPAHGNKIVGQGLFTVETPAPLSGHIERVEPDHGPPGASVVIKGTGFGKDQGNVQFGAVAVGTIDNWSETSISVRVPATGVGKVDVTVNPAHGDKIVGQGLFTVG